ncbi:MAG: hypothetical protein DME05_07465 [Candidatus Rokuibacteriota bacterium]|nr:MAG: hypothetical protein DME05_07465 [Candidatus Rokubacteria bacterium]
MGWTFSRSSLDSQGGGHADSQRDLRPDAHQVQARQCGGGQQDHPVRGTCTVNAGPAPAADLTITMAAQDWLDMIGGKLNGQMAFMSGKLKLKGDMGFAMKMGSLFSV